MQICEQNWKSLSHNFKGEIRKDFEKLKDAAIKLNNVISEEPELGKDFVIGHVFFAEAVQFLDQSLKHYQSGKKVFLFKQDGNLCDPMKDLWNLSLAPLLEQYISGLDNDTKKGIMTRIHDAFKPLKISTKRLFAY